MIVLAIKYRAIVHEYKEKGRYYRGLTAILRVIFYSRWFIYEMIVTSLYYAKKLKLIKISIMQNDDKSVIA